MASSPLYDIFDPDEELRRKAELHRLLTGERMSLTDLMPEEEKSSLLDRLSNAGSSGLATVGWIFDTPGAMVRSPVWRLAEGSVRAMGVQRRQSRWA